MHWPALERRKKAAGDKPCQHQYTDEVDPFAELRRREDTPVEHENRYFYSRYGGAVDLVGYIECLGSQIYRRDGIVVGGVCEERDADPPVKHNVS